MPDETGDHPAKTPKDEKRREQVLVAAAIAGVLLTVILIRRSSSSQAAPLPVSAPVGNSGNSGGGPSSGDFMSLQNQVYGLSGGLTMLEALLERQSSSPTTISQNPTPTPWSLGAGSRLNTPVTTNGVTSFAYASGPGDTANSINAALANLFHQQVDPSRGSHIAQVNHLASADSIIPTGTVLQIDSGP